MISVFLWATLVAPALCVAEIITHSCSCGDETGCGHEEDCLDDPCRSTLNIWNGPRSALDLSLPRVPNVSWFTAGEDALRSDSRGFREVEPPRFASLPFPTSDIPLLI